MLAGTVNLSSPGVRRQVKRYIIHGGYDADDNYNNDIALLEVIHTFEYILNYFYIILKGNLSPKRECQEGKIITQ